MLPLDLRSLRYFLSIVDAGSFTRAAERLHLTQPTLSHQIKRLEDQCATLLLDRTARGVHLTPAGEVLRDHARKALKELDSASAAIAELQGLTHGALVVGAFGSFNSSLLPPLLNDFANRYPGICVTVRQLATGEMEDQLLQGDLHLGIAYAPPTTELIVAEPLFAEELKVVVSTGHPWATRSAISIRELDGTPLALLTAEFPSRRLVEAQFQAVRIKPRVVLEINSVEAVLATVRFGRLATIFTERMAMTVPGLRCLDLSPTIRRTAAIFWRRCGYRTVAARAMDTLLRSAYTELAAGEGTPGE
jgi:LysR family transcriptional regulator, cyn operon transcriptional activator